MLPTLLLCLAGLFPLYTYGSPLLSIHDLRKRGQLPAFHLFEDGQCLVEGTMYGPEEFWHFSTHNSECFNCLCLPGAQVFCEPCNFCVVEDQIIQQGERFKPGPCNECRCIYGEVICHNVTCDEDLNDVVKT